MALFSSFFVLFGNLSLLLALESTYNTRKRNTFKMRDNQNTFEHGEKEILFSRSIKAGKRIYYVDVKQNSRGDMYLSLTESKKKVSGDPDMPQFNFEKHKIFIYPEDFEKFTAGLADAIKFIYDQNGPVEQRPEVERNDIQLDELEF